MGLLEQNLNAYCAQVELALEQFFPETPGNRQVIYDAARYSLLNGGKRLRPALLLEWYSLCGGKPEDALAFACGLEMIHCYSLVHDDLPCMDNDDFRRGKPSCHKAFGEAIAVLAGDALLNRAFEIMSIRSDVISAERQLAAIRQMSQLSGVCGMIGGQTMDMRCNSGDLAFMEEMVCLKTGALIKAACMCGCILAGGSKQMLQASEEYAACIGLAFQIEDDLLDADEENKFTYLSAYGETVCREKIMQLTERAAQICDSIPNGETLKELALWLAERKK